MIYTTYVVAIIEYKEIKSRKKNKTNIIFYLGMMGLFYFWDFQMIKLLI